jgi:hypothetical protein
VPFLVGFGGDARLRFLPWPCSTTRSDDELRLLAAQYSHGSLGPVPSLVDASNESAAALSVPLTAQELVDGWLSWRRLVPTVSSFPATLSAAASDPP